MPDRQGAILPIDWARHEILLFDHRMCTPHVVGYEKPCGGGLSPLVNRLFPDVMALPSPRRHPPRLVLRASDGSQVEYDLEQPVWASVSRADLGRALLERARANRNVRFAQGRVAGLDRMEKGWRLRSTSGEAFETDYLVGADGVRSAVRRKVLGPVSRQHLAQVVGFFLRYAPDAVIFQLS